MFQWRRKKKDEKKLKKIQRRVEERRENRKIVVELFLEQKYRVWLLGGAYTGPRWEAKEKYLEEWNGGGLLASRNTKWNSCTCPFSALLSSLILFLRTPPSLSHTHTKSRSFFLFRYYPTPPDPPQHFLSRSLVHILKFTSLTSTRFFSYTYLVPSLSLSSLSRHWRVE